MTYEYNLRAVCHRALDANSPFQYSIQPTYLSIIEKPTREYTEYQQQQKLASAGAAELEARIDPITGRYKSSWEPVGVNNDTVLHPIPTVNRIY
jgi:hypothetical protein